MTQEIPPIPGPTAVPPVAPVAPPPSATSPDGSKPVSVDAIPATPPPEVHDAIAVAAQSYHRLADQDRHLRFMIDERTGHFEIQVHDLKGNVLFTVPPVKALEVAAGGSLE
jgi:hypothetical protein